MEGPKRLTLARQIIALVLARQPDGWLKVFGTGVLFNVVFGKSANLLYNPAMDLTSLPNKPARLSLASAMLTIIFFCIGVAPIPLTALICYPAALLSGLTALLSGLRGLRYPSGRWMAWVGMITGTLTLLAITLFTALTALLAPILAETLQKLWQTLRP